MQLLYLLHQFQYKQWMLSPAYFNAILIEKISRRARFWIIYSFSQVILLSTLILWVSIKQSNNIFHQVWVQINLSCHQREAPLAECIVFCLDMLLGLCIRFNSYLWESLFSHLSICTCHSLICLRVCVSSSIHLVCRSRTWGRQICLS